MSAGRERERVRESALIRFMTLTAHWNRPSSSNAVERTEKWTPSDSDSAWTPSRAWSFICVRRTPDKPFDLFSLPKTERIFNIFMTHISRCHLPPSLLLSHSVACEWRRGCRRRERFMRFFDYVSLGFSILKSQLSNLWSFLPGTFPWRRHFYCFSFPHRNWINVYRIWFMVYVWYIWYYVVFLFFFFVASRICAL